MGTPLSPLTWRVLLALASSEDGLRTAELERRFGCKTADEAMAIYLVCLEVSNAAHEPLTVFANGRISLTRWGRTFLAGHTR